MRKSVTRRRSSSNPVRASTLDEEKSVVRGDVRRATQIGKSMVQTQTEGSQIPKPRIRSTSCDRSSIRPSNLKITGKTPLAQHQSSSARVSTATTQPHTQVTPRVSTSRLHPNLATGVRHRSPSVERASGFGAKYPRKDSRPLADRAYQTAMLAKIDAFFYNIQQSVLLNTNGSLKPITLKIFVEATGCLLLFLDVKHHLAVANYITEIPKIAKKLHYPGIVAKSWLQTANTMHSWPHVLGWLSWLCELCEAKDLATATFGPEKLPFGGDFDEAETMRSRLLVMARCYREWNNSNPEEEAAVLEEHIHQINNRYGDVEAEIDEARRDLEAEKYGIQVVEIQSSEIDEDVVRLRNILEALKQEEAQEIERIQLIEETAQRGGIEIDQLNRKSSALDQQIEKDIGDEAELGTLVENQPMSVTERDEILQRCTEIRNDIRQFENHVEDIEKELYAMDMKFSSCHRKLYKAILAFNKDVIMHLGCESGTNFEELKMPESNMLDPCFPELLRAREAAMLDLREKTRKQLKRVTAMTEARTNEFDALTEKLNILRDKNENHVAKVHGEKLCIMKMQSRAMKNEAKMREQMNILQNEIINMRESMPDLETYSDELAEVQDKYDAVVRRAEFAENKTERFFAKFYEVLGHHRKELAALVKELPEKLS